MSLLVRELVALLFGRAPNHDYNSARRESPADSRHSFLGTTPVEMMRRTVTAVLLALVLTAEPGAQADEPKVITLSCNGTLTPKYGTRSADPKPLQKAGVVVNLDEQSVSFEGFVTHINDVDAANINFSGKQFGGPSYGVSIDVIGSIDRVTGDMVAVWTVTSDPPKWPINPIDTSHYDLLCKVTNRVF